MALQTSIAEYFNLRKRGAVEDLKKVTPSNKVLILDKNAVAVDASKDVESSSTKTIIYAESPQGSTKKVSSAPRRSRKTPLIAVRRSSASKEKKDPTQPDIRKCLFPAKSAKSEETPPQVPEDTDSRPVNVPFRIHSLSPTKKPTTPTKNLSTTGGPEEKSEVDALPSPSGLEFTTPKKDVKLDVGSEEDASLKTEKAVKRNTLRIESLKKSTKLADLKNRLKKFNDGFNKLKEIQERKEKLPPSPKIQEFRTIELEVNVSPKKVTDVVEEVKSLKSPSLLRKAVFMSPTKLPPGASTYISPRKLFDKPPGASPTKPAYQRFYDLACAGKPALPLPYKYRCLAETFRSVDTVVSMMYNRNENVVFNKLRASVQQLSKRNLNETHVGQIMAVLPTAFELKREKVRTLGNQREQYELVFKPIIPEADASTDSKDRNEKVKASMSPSVILQRRRDFYNALLEKAKDQHELFLGSLNPPLVIPKDKLMRWHPDFDVDASCADIVPAPLPAVPVQEKLSTARDVLNKAKDMLSTNNRMERALERLSGTQTPPPTSETSAATAALAKALKGIPKSLLEKVRAKQAAKTAALLTRCPEETKRRLELTRLPELSRILRNIFVLERKNVIAQSVVLEKVTQSYREVLSQDDMLRHIHLIMESVPGWITEITDGDKKYLRLARDADFARITNRLHKLINDNSVNM